MELLYKVINFLILALILFIFAKKTVIAIFKNRREKIQSDLDEAEEILASPEPEKLSLPEIDEELFIDQEKLEVTQTTTDSMLAYIKKDTEEECLEMHREMVSKIESGIIDAIKKRTEELSLKEPYSSKIRAKEMEMVNKILEKIRITPGDIAYIKEREVLYVTLTSAFELPEEIVKLIGEKTKKMLEEVGGKQSYWVKQDESLIGGIRLRIGDTIYDCSVAEELYQLGKSARRQEFTGYENAEDLIKNLTEELSSIRSEVHIYQVGRVLTVSDGICWMDGLADIMYGEVVEFECGDLGMVLDIQHNEIGCVIFGRYQAIESGSRVRRVGKIAAVPVGDALLGRVVDSLGHAIDGKRKIRTKLRRPIECPAPGITDRMAVTRPLHTGIKAIDALVPIGRGQRELIIGDRQTGKSSIAIDAIINQKDKNVICIYVAIGQKDTTVAEIRDRLEKYGAIEYTVIVSASASKSASMQYMAPFAATAIGEHFMYEGKDVLIIYDDLSKHAVAYRELSLLLHRPSGREAYPGDIFYLHSRLLERSAQLTTELGGGSMTALPIIETLSGDISSYIPTNVISITDGQIFLDTELFYEGQRPAVNVGLSVSRVGSAAQTKLLKQVSSSLRMNLAQYRELSGFAQFGGDIDQQTQKVLSQGALMMETLKQGRYEPLSDWKQALIIYAVSSGFTANIELEEIESYEKNLYRFFRAKHRNLRKALKSGEKMTDELKKEIDDALVEYSEIKRLI